MSDRLKTTAAKALLGASGSAGTVLKPTSPRAHGEAYITHLEQPGYAIPSKLASLRYVRRIWASRPAGNALQHFGCFWGERRSCRTPARQHWWGKIDRGQPGAVFGWEKRPRKRPPSQVNPLATDLGNRPANALLRRWRL